MGSWMSSQELFVGREIVCQLLMKTRVDVLVDTFFLVAKATEMVLSSTGLSRVHTFPYSVSKIKRKGLERAYLHPPTVCEKNEGDLKLSLDSVFPPNRDKSIKICEK